MLRTTRSKIKFTGTFVSKTRLINKKQFKKDSFEYDLPRFITYNKETYIYDRKITEGQMEKYIYRTPTTYGKEVVIW